VEKFHLVRRTGVRLLEKRNEEKENEREEEEEGTTEKVTQNRDIQYTVLIRTRI